MKISTTQFFKTSTEQMQSRQRTVSDIQAQLGSGKQVVNPSDAPRKANLVSQLESAKELQSTYLRNVETARTRLTSEETVMTAMTEIAQRVSELAIQASNDTLGAEDRSIIGAEVSALRDELLNLANTKDLSGNYIFSGNKTQSPAFVEDASGTVSYNGDYGRHRVNLSEVRSLPVNTLGIELFTANDFLALDGLVDDLRSDDGPGIRDALSGVNTIVDKLTISFGDMAGRMTALDSQYEIIEDTQLRLDKLLMSENDVDYAEAVTELSRESLALQALQASFSKLSQLSLFNYIR
ncbi:MAG: flagellar hook-associated protein FlgL [Betaproteobacteria bacterium]|jgi:flagellar hook-associated protein 3 FlgL|nr:flagellar hook-associated protein FlgL [Betaproteobacteria bacterium]